MNIYRAHNCFAVVPQTKSGASSKARLTAFWMAAWYHRKDFPRKPYRSGAILACAQIHEPLIPNAEGQKAAEPPAAISCSYNNLVGSI